MVAGIFEFFQVELLLQLRLPGDVPGHDSDKRPPLLPVQVVRQLNPAPLPAIVQTHLNGLRTLLSLQRGSAMQQLRGMVKCIDHIKAIHIDAV